MKETLYEEEKALIFEKDNGSYTDCQPYVRQLPDKCRHRLDKVSIGKDFRPPTVQEIKAYCIVLKCSRSK